ncbi:gliding motility-associated C-terminal domain-containing protein [Aequorivita viscosa]|uniref:Gliding motility-associated C-terminal domain-containing protein n=1 Tax=Aequorivita viscosa TaxID=797419 RepID=A0A1M6HE97_9FLAO|nr:gliding motility-associated C-terminal domain-containing protein [Aequorivita viscosa]SDW91345.1 gliding motility-associated C-terminal domain-containing protein [Aequorivita viscosa]SHJ20476.1 gliding motility-associated C-terminal domain-containing protein [Aequorivita viscosa]
MKKKLPPCLRSCLNFLKVNFARNTFLLFSFVAISLQALAQGPGHPNVDAGEDIEIPCNEDCTELNASYLYTGDTSDYAVSSIPYAPPFPFTGGTPVSVNIDDRWSSAITLPFDFCFYGETYTEMVIGSNAVVSFDLAQNTPGGFCDWSFDESIPDPNLFHTAIFGPYMDVNPAVGGSGNINWTVFGDAPDRTMVVNFPGIPYFGSACSGSSLTSQIVMYETTNVIEVYIQDRPGGCTWNDGNAVIGIQNQDGTIGETAPGRNTGNWSATNEAWRFTPNGPPNVVFSWLDADGNEISTNPTITVCPTDPVTVYTAQAVYTNCNGDVVTVTDDVQVSLDGDFDLTLDLGPDLALCDVPSYEIVPTITGDITGATYLWSPGGETTPTITVTDSGIYTLEVTKGDCSIIDSVELSFGETVDLSNDLPTELQICSIDPIPVLDATPTTPGIDLTLVTYEWTDSSGTVVSTDATFTPTVGGTYNVTVTYAPCSQETFTIDIIISNQPILDLGPDKVVCAGGTFEIVPTIPGGTTGVTFLWSTGETTPTITVSETGTYTLDISIGSCTATDSIVVTFTEPIVVSLGDDFESCFEANTTITATVNDASNMTFEWFMNGVLLAGETNQTLEIFEVGEYSVIVTDANGCTGEDSIIVSGRDDLEVTLGADFQTCPNETQTITATTSEEGVTYQWLLNGNVIAGETNSTLDISLDAGLMGTQTYSVIISTGGCTGEDSIDVTLYPVGNCVISQGISPNGDGFNDVLDLTFLNDRTGIKKLQIFNRYGAIVFEQVNYTNQWKGQSKNGNDLPTGTYFYVIDLAGNDSVYGQQATGWIYLNQKAN